MRILVCFNVTPIRKCLNCNLVISPTFYQIWFCLSILFRSLDIIRFPNMSSFNKWHESWDKLNGHVFHLFFFWLPHHDAHDELPPLHDTRFPPSDCAVSLLSLTALSLMWNATLVLTQAVIVIIIERQLKLTTFILRRCTNNNVCLYFKNN